MRRAYFGALCAALCGASASLAQMGPEFRPATGFQYPMAPAVAPTPGYYPQAGYYPQPTYYPQAQQPYYYAPRPAMPAPQMYPAATMMPARWPQASTSYRVQQLAAPYSVSGPTVVPNRVPTMPPAGDEPMPGKAFPAAAEPLHNPARALPSLPEHAAPAHAGPIAAPAGPSCDGGACCDDCKPDRKGLLEKWKGKKDKCEPECCEPRKAKRKLGDGWGGNKKCKEECCEPACGWEDDGGDFGGWGCYGPRPCGKQKKCFNEDRCAYVWGSADFLYWVLDKPNLPVLAQFAGGATALGASTIDQDGFVGGHVNVGFHLCQPLSLEFEGFYLSENSDAVGVASTAGVPPITQPLLDFGTGVLAAIPIGSVDVQADTQMYGGETNLLYHVCCGESAFLNLIGGFRYLRLEDDLNVASTPVVAGAGPSYSDLFQTRSEFYGGQVGVQTGLQCGRYYFLTTGKIALGVTSESVEASGATTLAGVTTTGGLYTGGLLGRERSVQDFAYVPEVKFEVGFQVCRHVSLKVGYSGLYWSRVARAGDQIIAGQNALMVPSVADTQIWVHGANAGLAIRY